MWSPWCCWERALATYFQQIGPQDHLEALHALECLSLGRSYDALGWIEAGVIAYRAALDRHPTNEEQVQILRELGFLYKRQGNRDEAAALWEAWIGSVAGDDLTPYIELAKYHEWHTGDLTAARGWAAWALRIAEGWPPGSARETRHRGIAPSAGPAGAKTVRRKGR